MSSEDARQHVAAQLRELADRLATDELPSEDWNALSGLLGRAISSLPRDRPTRTRFARDHFEDDGATVDPPSTRHPLGRGTSGVYPPFEITYEGDLMVSEIAFGPAFEGPPGLVHGGFLAAGFDIMLSAMAHHRLGTSVTRRLTVRYLKPTLLGTPLRYEIRAGEQDGRLLDLTGTLVAAGRVTMRASAQFATVTSDRFRRHGDDDPGA